MLRCGLVWLINHAARLARDMQRQGWKIEQVSFITGTGALNEEDLKRNLTYFEVPPTSIEV